MNETGGGWINPVKPLPKPKGLTSVAKKATTTITAKGRKGGNWSPVSVAQNPFAPELAPPPATSTPPLPGRPPQFPIDQFPGGQFPGGQFPGGEDRFAIWKRLAGAALGRNPGAPGTGW